MLEGEDLSEEVRALDRRGRSSASSTQYTNAEYGEEWDLDALVHAMHDLYGTDDHARRAARGGRRSTARRSSRSSRRTRATSYNEKEERFGPNPDTEQPLLRDVERFVILQIVDRRWREHLENMDYLREGIHLRAMAQKDPLVEYRAEGHVMFEELARRSARRSC